MAKRQQASKPPKSAKSVEALRHTDDRRLNIPTAEHQSVLEADGTVAVFTQQMPHGQGHETTLAQVAADELDDYKEVPLEKLRPWRQGTGPGLRDWLVARGYDPQVVDFGTPLEL